VSTIGGAGGYRPNPYDESEAGRAASGAHPAVPASGAQPAVPAPAGAFSFSPLRSRGGIDLGIPGLGGSGGLAGLEIGLPRYDEQGSFAVRSLGEATLAGLDAAARANTTGPEAKLRATAKGLLEDALRSIEADEAKARRLPLESPERRKLEDRIDARVARFRSDLALETRKTAAEVKARAGAGGGGALDRLKSMLPPYLRECVEREGIVVPGVPGAFRPRTDDGVFKGPTGLDYKVEL
jgi:hypothetical protein